MTSGKKAGERMVSDANLWRVDRVSGNRLHNAQKPVELIQRALKNSSDEGGLVLDLFCGSGSTLVAAHSMKRVARLMEIDCKWADVTLRRCAPVGGGWCRSGRRSLGTRHRAPQAPRTCAPRS
jgi:DNA modification methylase